MISLLSLLKEIELGVSIKDVDKAYSNAFVKDPYGTNRIIVNYIKPGREYNGNFIQWLEKLDQETLNKLYQDLKKIKNSIYINEIEIENPNIRFVRDLEYIPPYSKIDNFPIDFKGNTRKLSGGRFKDIAFDLWRSDLMQLYGDDIKIKISKNYDKKYWFHDEFVLTLVK